MAEVSSYPQDFDGLAQKYPGMLYAADVNKLIAAVNQLQQVLGLNPAGIDDTVADRLNNFNALSPADVAELHRLSALHPPVVQQVVSNARMVVTAEQHLTSGGNTIITAVAANWSDPWYAHYAGSSIIVDRADSALAIKASLSLRTPLGNPPLFKVAVRQLRAGAAVNYVSGTNSTQVSPYTGTLAVQAGDELRLEVEPSAAFDNYVVGGYLQVGPDR